MLAAVFAAGLTTAGTLSFGASANGSADSACLPGDGSITGATLSLSPDKRTVTADFSVAPGCSGTTVSLAIYAMLTAPEQDYPQALFDSESQTFDAGAHVLTVRTPNCYWQADLVTGSVLPEINAGSLYGGRKAIAAFGGNARCATTTTTTTSTTTTATTSTTATTTSTTTTATTSTTTGTTTTGTTGTTTTGTTSTATTQSATTAPAPSITTAPAPLVVPSVADAAVTKVADRSGATVGQQVTYTLTAANNGPATALDVVLVDPLPAEETLVSVSDAACTGTTVITCSFGSLAAGASRGITVVTLARLAGTATNVATVSTTSPESSTANNQAQATVTIRGVFKPPPLCAQLSLRHSTLIAGRRTTLLVHVRNRGTAVAGARVEVRGPGILVVRKTDARGRARFTVKPRRVGVLRVRLLQAQSCPRALAEVPVPGALLPPLLTG